jgi:hypothetical protein
MTMRDFSAFVDFVHPLPLVQLADLLSRSLFGGIRFTGLNEGLWDEVPAMRLEADFLGLRVEFGGAPGEQAGYTLQIEPIDVPVYGGGNHDGSDQVGDLSWYVGYLLGKLEGVGLVQSSRTPSS